jgi:uncharacterized protein
MKNKMMWVLSLLVAFVPVASAQGVSGVPFIAAQGEARAEVVPDIFPLKVTLTETSMDAAATQKKIEALASDIIETAKMMNVAEDDITVGNLVISIEERYDDKTEQEIFVGNSYERVISLRFHDLAALKAFVDRLPTGKAVRAATGTFAYSKAEAERKKLLQEAMDDAKETAEQIATGLGKKIIGVQNVSDRPMNASYFGNGANLDALQVRGNVALTAPGTVRGQSEMALKKGVITLERTIYIIYLFGN